MSVLGRDWFTVGHTAKWAAMVSVLSVLPVLAAIGIVGRYLAAEPDEFIRALLTRALLWGFAVAMVGDAVAGALTEVYGGHLPVVVLTRICCLLGLG